MRPEDDAKIEKIHIKYYSTMIHTALNYLNDYALAEDAVSESMIKIINHLDDIKDIASKETRKFIIIIVKNTAIDMIRKRNRRNEDGVPIEDMEEIIGDSDMTNVPIEVLLSKEGYDSLIEKIRSLPEKLSDTLYLCEVEGYSYDEVAKILNISRDAVKMRVSRAKESLRESLLEEEKNGKQRKK